MLFEKILKFLYNDIFSNIILGIGFIWLALWAYHRSVKSRKYYKCPQCGERFRVENMENKSCDVCGAELENIGEIND